MKTYHVTAQRWAHGWELHIDGIGVTQSHSVKAAEAMVQDYLRLEGVDGPVKIEICYKVGDGLDEAARAARRAVAEASEAQARAAEQSRSVARRLKEKGLKGREVAAVLGLSEQRVSQLLKPARNKTA